MRRFLLFILAVLYLEVSSRFTLSYHYCIGRLTKVSLLYPDTCPSCGETGTSYKRYSTETGHAESLVDQDMADTPIQLSAPVAVASLSGLPNLYKITRRDETTRSNPFINPPREDSAIPLFIHRCTLLIWRYKLPF